MIRSTLGLFLIGVTCIAPASAQSRYADYYAQRYGDGYASNGRDYYDGRDSGNYDYARVVRVDPIIAAPPPPQQQCYYRDADDAYARGGDYHDGNGQRQATPGGRIAATIAGGVLGAVVGSRFGGGTGRVIGTAVGTAAGTAAGQSVYDNSHTERGTVRVCEPVSDQRYEGEVEGYNVTYEYAGRTYQTRTAYNPGDRIRVRVDVVAAQN
ncbi:glycine zipper 2TM domain-containing protein [Pseudoxanthomonas winnipegensis]|uniref:Glycine zipper 2TM domain-containing protein n=1 Tax=Pseudoxanthomonas winnipegensis TaxID=2480810 RepID=A0A4Q8LWC4_9GAMM|nr:glycine zipper 2TM domain-containing protein [Pseudoxanthomonas winnipegensis]TAA36499.1 glycine zipper 2TM domain-containing protein [Pseudoxanthomonas winnipegensis]